MMIIRLCGDETSWMVVAEATDTVAGGVYSRGSIAGRFIGCKGLITLIRPAEWCRQGALSAVQQQIGPLRI